MTKIMWFMKKSSVWQNFVRSDKISTSVRPMSDKTPEYFDSTVICPNKIWSPPPSQNQMVVPLQASPKGSKV